MQSVSHRLAFYSSTAVLNIATILVLAGLSMGWWIKTNTGVIPNTAPVFSSINKVDPTIKSGVPVKLTIPSIGVALKVKPGMYNTSDGSWTLNNNDAFFATPSSPVNNEKGTSLIYGHNVDQVFGMLQNVTPGAKLLVATDTNYLFEYRYSFASQVAPEDVSIFNDDTAPNVTLQTCSGNWDELRSMYNFTLKKVRKVS